MNDNLEQIFREEVAQKYKFLNKDFGFIFFQEYTWRLVAKSSFCHVVMEYEKEHFACWIERFDEDFAVNDRYRGINVVLIATCKGYSHIIPDPQLHSKKEIIEEEIDENSNLLRKYCSAFLNGDFSEWPEIITCLRRQYRFNKYDEYRNVFHHE
jgi:hypothetical protein